MSYCRLGEHDCIETEYIESNRSCVACYNIAQVGTGSFCHKLSKIDHTRLERAGYLFDEKVGYIKL